MVAIATPHRAAVATPDEVAFVRNLGSPDAVLAAVERGKDGVAAAKNQIEAGAAMAACWRDIKELEGDETADLIVELMWPNEPLAAAA